MPYPVSLDAWLARIEAQHPQHQIALGLERVRRVHERLGCVPQCPVFILTGTNGKGSTSAMIAAMLKAGGYRAGLYLSPHLLRYNERIKIDGIDVSDAALCAAFAAVETARRQEPEVPLTYFEMGTLAAFWLFARARLDAWVLEVGLGGRLDAVNVIDADAAVVTAVDIDHTDYLGTSREAIGFEKAGIARRGRPLICGDLDPPASLRRHLDAIAARGVFLNRDFGVADAGSGEGQWRYWRRNAAHEKNETVYPQPALAGAHQLSNAAMALTALDSLAARLPLSEEAKARGLREVQLAGRLHQVSAAPDILCDVAHNPHAARALADYLKNRPAPAAGRSIAVLAMLADKDIGGVIDSVRDVFDCWWVAPLPAPRGAGAQRLMDALAAVGIGAERRRAFDSVTAACAHAAVTLARTDRMVAFGSFLTVSEALSYYATHSAPPRSAEGAP